jgi:hypothetical protein
MTKLRTARTTPPSTGSYQACKLGRWGAPALTFWLPRIWFRPRVLRDVTKVDWSTTILGHPSAMPIYIVCGFGLCANFLLLTLYTDGDGTWEARTSRRRAEFDSRRSKARCHPDGTPPCTLSCSQLIQPWPRYLLCRHVPSTN